MGPIRWKVRETQPFGASRSSNEHAQFAGQRTERCSSVEVTRRRPGCRSAPLPTLHTLGALSEGKRRYEEHPCQCEKQHAHFHAVIFFAANGGVNKKS
jgi:hypothetical protein